MKDSYPFRKITKEEAIADYAKLRSVKNAKLGFQRVGNKATDYFFEKYRVKTKYRNISKYEAWMNPVRRSKIKEFTKRLYNTEAYSENNLRSSLDYMFGSVQQFKPSNAQAIYDKFKPKRVLDFSAGWGGRLLGAMSRDIDYIGIDSNKKLSKPYLDMLNTYESKSRVKMIFKRSETVDFAKLGGYDMVFTSPPYLEIEKYEGMKSYGDKFYDEFFIPVVKRAFDNLSEGGVMLLNMPHEMYLEWRKVVDRPIKKIKMPINNRQNDGNQKFELIYWVKK